MEREKNGTALDDWRKLLEEANGELKKGDWVSDGEKKERRKCGSSVVRVLATRVIFRCV
jgi:hypothetical protein